jgi:hypothetical protein
MDPEVVFHRLVQRDMDDILDYYKQNAPSSVANRFFDQFISTVNQVAGILDTLPRSPVFSAGRKCLGSPFIFCSEKQQRAFGF